MSHIPHFEEPGRINRDHRVPADFWMSLDTYAQALDTVVILAHLIPITDDEKRYMSLTRAEYDAWVWINPQTLATLLKGDRPIDSILHQIIADCWTAQSPDYT